MSLSSPVYQVLGRMLYRKEIQATRLPKDLQDNYPHHSIGAAITREDVTRLRNLWRCACLPRLSCPGAYFGSQDGIAGNGPPAGEDSVRCFRDGEAVARTLPPWGMVPCA